MSFFNFHHHQVSGSGIYNLNLMEQPTEALFSAGIHPKEVSNLTHENLVWLEKATAQKNCVAIGECGLDGLVAAPIELQKQIFSQQISLAEDLDKPLIIHCVKRYQEVIEFKKKSRASFTIHGFNKNEVLGQQLLQKDFYLSFGKSLLQNVNLQGFFKTIPESKFFLETDSAELSIELMYQKAAELKNTTPEKIQEIIFENLIKIKIEL